MHKKEYKLESKLQKDVNEYLKDEGWFFHPSDKYIKGIPDIIGVCNGKFVAIELKVKNRKPSTLQKITLNRIEKAGGKSYVARSLEEVKDIIEKIKEDKNE